MSRLIIGREGRIVTSHEPDDWLEARAGTSTGRLTDEPATTDEALPPGTGAASSARARMSHRRPANGRRRIAVLTVTLTATATALLLAIVLRDGQRSASPSSTTTPTAAAPSTVGSATTAKQTAAVAASPSVELPPRGRLWRGDRGTRVKRLQTALAAAGLDPGKPDGIFGRQTRSAVIAFQEAHDLTADGIVGPKTAAALNAKLAGRGS
jgi:hypothetical protein